MTYSKDLGLNQKDAVAIGCGSTKPAEPDDPMQMQAESVSGDQRVMLECLIEEFAHIGWDAKQIARMFDNPFFLASHGLAKQLGRKAVHECIERTLQRCGVMRCAISESKPTQRSQFVNLSTSGDDSSREQRKPI
ncbi:MAG: hypothetical protein V3R51_00895 [Gammaproteobacteria bacterium]